MVKRSIFVLALAALGAGCGSGECPAGFIDLGGTCFNMSSDPENCGALGNSCPPGHVCEQGRCVLTCQEGWIQCAGICRDLAGDDYNCGSCGLACATGYMCADGSCVPECPDGYTSCSSICKNLLNDPSNCGECENACPAGEVCSAGSCTFTCPAPYVDCSGSCRDLASDRLNCGVCDNTCLEGRVCNGGTCELTCASPLVDCGGFCTYLDTDPENCGTCGAVCDETHAMAYCSSGSCGLICATGYDDCDADVTTGCETNLMRDNSNCGSCGTVCPTDEVCYMGICQVLTCFAWPWSEDFHRGVTPTAQCTSWDTWRASLDATGCTSVTISGTYDTTGITCADPVMVSEFATAIRTGLRGSWTCDGHTWSICNRYHGEVWIDPPAECSGSNCPNPGYIIRACIGNANWGGDQHRYLLDEPGPDDVAVVPLGASTPA